VQGVDSACVSPNGVVCWVALTEEAASATAVVHLLADRADLVEAVTDRSSLAVAGRCS
jgi:hypothetical protein